MASFTLLIYADEKAYDDLDEATYGAVMAEYGTFTEELVASGAMRGGAQLQRSTTARTVGAGGVVSDGPFADTAEHLGGYYLVDVDDADAALAWAARVPGVGRGLDRVEVRPVVER